MTTTQGTPTQPSPVDELQRKLSASQEETKEAIEQQTAVSEVLATISRSAFDLPTVLQTIVEHAASLAHADTAVLYRLEGSDLVVVGRHGAERVTRAPELGSRTPADGPTLAARAARTLTSHYAEDVRKDPSLHRGGTRTRFAVPIQRDGQALGSIVVAHVDVVPFTDRQQAIVATFADQAAIAIENVRLFNETKEALERQTAISEILRAISRSPTDVDPVLLSVVENAVRLAGADNGSVVRINDDVGTIAVSVGQTEEIAAAGREFYRTHRLVAGRESLTGRVLLERRSVQIPDLSADPDYVAAPLVAQQRRALLGVPLLRANEIIGVIILRKAGPHTFLPQQVRLVEAFADQAVIAIENVRLFNETKEALDQQTATTEVLKVISRATFEIDRVLDIVVTSATTLCSAERGSLWRIAADGAFRLSAYFGGDPEYRAIQQAGTLVVDPTTISGRVALERRTIHVTDVAAPDSGYRLGRTGGANPPRASLGVPLLRDDELFGVFVLTRSEPRPFSDREIALVAAFADQAVIAIENVRLVSEIQEQSRQLEAASRHKSEFLANMSHELRTPLNAIIGFSEVLEQRMFGELNERQAEYTHDIATSGKHLLNLVNEILDLAKVEAGRMELEPSAFAPAETIRGALGFVRERAAEHRITLGTDLPEDLGTLVADERKIRQVLLNLLSNAVKFTPDGGRVTLRARHRDGELEVAVQDTGIGIAPADLPRVFEEFQQVGPTTDRSREGTGLGLTLAKRFVELHGGRIWVESTIGVGTTFTVAIPVRNAAPTSG